MLRIICVDRQSITDVSG